MKKNKGVTNSNLAASVSRAYVYLPAGLGSNLFVLRRPIACLVVSFLLTDPSTEPKITASNYEYVVVATSTDDIKIILSKMPSLQDSL